MPDRIMTAEARITARDVTGKVFDHVAQKMKGIERASKGLNATMMGAAGRTVGAVAAIAGPAAIGAIVSSSIQSAAAAERRMSRLLITADASKTAVASTMMTVNTLAQEVALPVDQVISALENLVAQGKSLPEALSLLPAVIRTAQASGAAADDLAASVGALATSFGVTGESAQSFFDIMNEGGKAGQFELKDMARYIPSLGAQAAAAGLKGEEGFRKLIAAAQTIRKQTGTAEEAAASLSDTLGKMETDETAKKFRKFGVDIRKVLADARKGGKDVLDVFLDATWKAIGGDLSKLTQIFGDKEAQRGVRALLMQRDALNALAASLKGVDGSTLRDLNRIVGDTQSNIDRMANSWERAKQSLGKGLGPIASAVLNAASNVMDEGGDIPDNVITGPTFLPGEAPLAYGRSSQTARSAYRVWANERRSGVRGMALGRAAERSVAIPWNPTENPRTGWRSPQRWGAWWVGGKTPGQMIEEEQAGAKELGRYRDQWKVLRQKTPNMTDEEAWNFFMNRLGRGGLNEYRNLRNSEADRNKVPRPGEPEIRAGYRESVTKLEGAVDVNTSFTVKFDTGDIRAAVADMVQTIVSSNPFLRGNGPGSVGTSSPDAKAPAPAAPARHVGRGDL